MQRPMDDLQSSVESVFRRESGRIIAGLIRVSGSFDLAEEAMQDAFAVALARWPAHGMPDQPGRLDHGCRPSQIDRLCPPRSNPARQGRRTPSQWRTHAGADEDPSIEAAEMNIPDDRLRLIFTCCHPALNADAQVALTLRTLGGLSTPEIARAFLLPEPTLGAETGAGQAQDPGRAVFPMKFLLRTGWPNAWLPCRRSFT